MEDDAKKALAAIGIIVGMIVVGEHAYNQEKSMFSALVRVIRG